MRAYQAHQFIPLKWSGRNWARRMGWSREELDEELAAFYDRIFTRYIESQGKARWGDKTPLHTWHVDGMARLYPDAQFIGMLRHPGGSVGSNMTRFGHPFGRAVNHVERYDREIARQAAKRPNRFAIVRYEELVLRPEPLLRELLDWLGEPWSDKVLQHHEVQTAKSGGKLVVEGTNRIDDAIDVSRVAKWHKRMSEMHRRSMDNADGPAVRVLRLRHGRPGGARAAARRRQAADPRLRRRRRGCRRVPGPQARREGGPGTRRAPLPPGPHAAVRRRRARRRSRRRRPSRRSTCACSACSRCRSGSDSIPSAGACAAASGTCAGGSGVDARVAPAPPPRRARGRRAPRGAGARERAPAAGPGARRRLGQPPARPRLGHGRHDPHDADDRRLPRRASRRRGRERVPAARRAVLRDSRPACACARSSTATGCSPGCRAS